VNVHLITLVGVNIDVLPFMLDHYREQGTTSAVLNVHQRWPGDPVLAAVRSIADPRGIEVASTFVGEWQSCQESVWRAAMQHHANDWCVLADQDELQVYPDDLRSVLGYCDRKGYDSVTGAFVDRVSADGGFPAVDPAVALWSQFPLGGFISHPMLGADPRKVVAAKGSVIVTKGQHLPLTGTPCPIDDAFVQVHHFKWTAGLVQRLEARAAQLRQGNVTHWTESDRFIRYIQTHRGRIDVADRRFLIAPCGRTYPHWERLTSTAKVFRMAAAPRSAA
jgi:hypothetical protein